MNDDTPSSKPITIPEDNVLNAALAFVRDRLKLHGGAFSDRFLAELHRVDPALHRLLLAARRLDVLRAQTSQERRKARDERAARNRAFKRVVEQRRKAKAAR